MELRNSIFFLTFCCTILALGTSTLHEGNGYIFTSPRVLKVGENNQIQIYRFGNREAGYLEVRLYYDKSYNDNETLASTHYFELGEGFKLLTFYVFVEPFEIDNVYQGRIQIDGFIGNEEFSGTDDISYATPKSSIVVIQTDRGLYRAKDTVKIRFLCLDSDLKASHQSKDVGNVSIQDPRGITLFQQIGIYLGNGLAETQFDLANEPGLGIWTITLETNKYTESTTFEVEVYQPPKFELTITFPPYILATTIIVPITVCANFTYGKPVKGLLSLNVSIDQYIYYDPSSSFNKHPIDEHNFTIKGCRTYNANITAIQVDPKNPNYYSSIMVVANVTQEGTGVQISKTAYFERTIYPLTLYFVSDTNGKIYFKLGLPYFGKLRVTNPDGTPAGGEEIEISYTVVKQRVIAGYRGERIVKYSKNFTSDQNGEIKFIIPPLNSDATSVTIVATSYKYSGDPVLNNPFDSQYLTPFYSQSGSYMQLANVEETIPCGTRKNFKLLFTSEANTDYKLYYQILKRGEVVQSGQKYVHFDEKDDVSHCFYDDNRLINGRQETLVPSPEQTGSSCGEDENNNCPAARESRFLPLVGKTKIDIDVDYRLSDEFCLIVFYVRYDKETVAASENFKVDKCFQNKVSFKFTDSIKQPGQTTNIQITTSPKSLCGVRVIDKSVTLLDKNNNNLLNKDKIFDLINTMDFDIYYPEDLCNQDNPHQPGLEDKSISFLPPGPGSYSSSDDSYAVFQECGLLVISNLYLFNRKCQKNNYNPGGPIYYEDKLGALPGPAPFPAEPIGTVSAVDVREDFPETWLFGLVTVRKDGILIKTETLPGTITEWIGDAVCVSPDIGLGISDVATIIGFQLFFISYTLPNSVVRGEIFTVVVSVTNYARGSLSIAVSLDDPQGFEVVGGTVNQKVCIQPDSSQNSYLNLKATTVGKISITVRAETTKNGSVCVPPGSNQYARDAITQSLDVVAEGFPVQEITSILFCPLDEPGKSYEKTLQLSLPKGSVNGSVRYFLDVSGNLLGPTIENIDDLIQLPSGCGEQNMIYFVPNFLALDYLKAIGQLDEKTRLKAIKNLEIGYQNELFYIHNDGSFSAFGQIDKTGSMFLTAYIIWSFREAQWYIYIDESVIKNAQNWIVGLQTADGCFPDIGQIIDSGLEGGIENDKSPTTITAYVLASLIVSKYHNRTVINNADKCLKNHPPIIPYEKVLVAYAYALDGKKADAQKLIDGLESLAETDENGAKTYPNPNGTDATNLETVAYAVLAKLLLNNDLNSILPLGMTLAQNLSADGGYCSTQDTVVGLLALSRFGKLIYKKNTNLTISVSEALNEVLKVTNDNKILVQRKQITHVPGNLHITATGSGCGLIQIIKRYNSISPPNANNYYIRVIGQCHGYKCADRKISGTVRYLPTGKSAGFTIVIIKMITGIYADDDDIKKLPGQNGNNILRADYDGENIVLYYNDLTNDGDSFVFQVKRDVIVDNHQLGSATVVRYYDPVVSSTTTYTFDDIKTALPKKK